MSVCLNILMTKLILMCVNLTPGFLLCMRIVQTPFKPRFTILERQVRTQFSHSEKKVGEWDIRREESAKLFTLNTLKL